MSEKAVSELLPFECEINRRRFIRLKKDVKEFLGGEFVLFPTPNAIRLYSVDEFQELISGVADLPSAATALREICSLAQQSLDERTLAFQITRMSERLEDRITSPDGRHRLRFERKEGYIEITFVDSQIP